MQEEFVLSQTIVIVLKIGRLQNDEIVDSTKVGKNIPEKSQKEDEFYFDLKCHGAEIIFYDCNDRIIIESIRFYLYNL